MLAAARANPAVLHIGLDTNIASLKAAAATARRKPARGGAVNALFVAGSFEDVPGPLAGCANAISVYLPWGSLLAGVMTVDGLCRLRAVAAEAASLDVVVSYDPARDAAEWSRLGIEPACLVGIERSYALAGWSGVRCSEISMAQLKATGTTWAAKLAMGPTRSAWRITARC